MVSTDISIHALRKESDDQYDDLVKQFDISIHALRKESDSVCECCECLKNISIHALRKESDTMASRPTGGTSAFQSTLSVRRATAALRVIGSARADFNPRSP